MTENTYNETEMSHLLCERFYGIYFDTQKRSDGEVLFKIHPSNKWVNCEEFEKTLCSLQINGSPTVDEIESLIAYYTK